MADAVNWRNLLTRTEPVACYRDGPVSQWPPEAVQQLRARIAVNITVLADPTWEVFDSETGNAGVDAVASGVRTRLDRRLWSWVYVNADLCPIQTNALVARGVHWTDSHFFPEPGCYLWAAAPGTTPGRTPPWCPVPPIAVQDRWLGGYDLSTLFTSITPPAPKPPPPPPPKPPSPPPERVIVVNLHQLQQNASGDDVRALQLLLNGRGSYALHPDGIFGPRTLAAVRDFQSRRNLGVDGIAGVHTWGALLGVPQ